MTILEINEAIAKELGFSNLQSNTNWFTRPGGEKQFYSTLETHWSELIPQYFWSLDACARFEVILIDEERRKYSKYLLDVAFAGHPPVDAVLSHNELTWLGLFKAVSASASERCEAFLRLKGLWRE